METDPDPGAVIEREDAAAGSPNSETWLCVDGVMVIPASGETITAEMVQRMVDEDRDRHVMTLGIDR